METNEDAKKKQKSGDAVGRPSGQSSLRSDPGAKFFCENWGRGTKQEKTGAGISSAEEKTSTSFLRHEEIYRSDVRVGQKLGAATRVTAPVLIGCDEFPVGYSLTGCPPAEPASASPTADDSQQSTLPYNDFSANGNYPLNIVSHAKGALHCCPAAPWFQLYAVKDCIDLCHANQHILENFPTFMFFGSNGGLETIAFDLRVGPPRPIIGRIAGPESAKEIAPNMGAFIEAIGTEAERQD